MTAAAKKAPAKRAGTAAKPTSNNQLRAELEQTKADVVVLQGQMKEMTDFLRAFVAQQAAQAAAPLLQQQLEKQIHERMSSVPLSELGSALNNATPGGTPQA